MRFIRRVAACVLFLPLAVPFMVVVPLTLLGTLLGWLVLGWRGQRIEAFLFNPVLCWADDLPLRLFREGE